jgi:hypothetical protein
MVICSGLIPAGRVYLDLTFFTDISDSLATEKQ